MLTLDVERGYRIIILDLLACRPRIQVGTYVGKSDKSLCSLPRSQPCFLPQFKQSMYPSVIKRLLWVVSNHSVLDFSTRLILWQYCCEKIDLDQTPQNSTRESKSNDAGLSF